MRNFSTLKIFRGQNNLLTHLPLLIPSHSTERLFLKHKIRPQTPLFKTLYLLLIKTLRVKKQMSDQYPQSPVRCEPCTPTRLSPNHITLALAHALQTPSFRSASQKCLSPKHVALNQTNCTYREATDKAQVFQKPVEGLRCQSRGRFSPRTRGRQRS